MKFNPGDIVRHKHGDRYEIIGWGKLESDLSTVYVYRNVATASDFLWVRGKTQMEDGRFELDLDGEAAE